jgi:pimeloyl-ACP methyl ester carboxylesterase
MVGFGESQRPDPAPSAEEQVRSLAEFLDAVVPGEQAVIVASGLSSNIALLLSARHPAKVSRLILWMPDIALGKANPSRGWHRLAWFPRLAKLVYRHQLSAETFLRPWMLRSGFTTEDPSLEESLSVIASTAQQYGAEHSFLAQCSKSYWRGLRAGLAGLDAPVTMLLATGSDRDSSEAISDLRPIVRRFSIGEVVVRGILAPLAEPEAVSRALAGELSSTDQEMPPAP